MMYKIKKKKSERKGQGMRGEGGGKSVKIV